MNPSVIGKPVSKSFCLVCGSTMGTGGRNQCGQMKKEPAQASVQEAQQDTSNEKLHFNYFFNVFQVNLEEFGKNEKGKSAGQQHLVSFCDNCEQLLKLLWNTRRKIVELEKELQRNVEETRRKMESSEVTFQRERIYNSNGTYFKVRRSILGGLVTPSTKRPVGRPRTSVRIEVMRSSSSFETDAVHTLPKEPPQSTSVEGNNCLTSSFGIEMLPLQEDVKEEPAEGGVDTDDDHNDDSNETLQTCDEAQIYDETNDGDYSPSEFSENSSSESSSDDVDPDFEPVQRKIPSRENRSRAKPKLDLKESSSSSKSINKVRLVKTQRRAKKDIQRRRRVAVEKTPAEQLSENIFSYFDMKFEKQGEETYKCLECSKSEQKLSLIKRHIIRSHTDLFVCEHCGQHKASPQDLSAHIREVHKGRKRKTVKNKECPICGKPFSDTIHLEYHATTHYSKEERMEAEANGVTLKRQKWLKSKSSKSLQVQKQKKKLQKGSTESMDDGRVHKRSKDLFQILHVKFVRDNDGKYRCLECSQRCSSRNIAKIHTFRRHSDRFACGECGKRNGSQADLSEHIRRMHHGEKKEKKTCPICGKPYSAKRTQATHAFTHFNEEEKREAEARGENLFHKKAREYQCVQCGHIFKCLSSLKFHEKRVHPSSKEDTEQTQCMCPHCGKMFVRWSIRVHMKKCGSKVDAPAPGRSKSKVKDASSQKRFKCVHCAKDFVHKSALRIHTLRHLGVRNSKCDICGRAFAETSDVTRHKKRVHQNAQFPCQLCPSSFVNYSHFRRHMIQMHGEKRGRQGRQQIGDSL